MASSSTTTTTIDSSLLAAALPPLPPTPGAVLRPLIEDDFNGALQFQYGRSKTAREKENAPERERWSMPLSLNDGDAHLTSSTSAKPKKKNSPSRPLWRGARLRLRVSGLLVRRRAYGSGRAPRPRRV